MTFEQAKSLQHGDVIHHNTRKNADGSCKRWRVNGRVKLWKTRPGEFRVPVKYGLYGYDYFTHHELDEMHLASECKMERRKEQAK